MGKNSKMSIWYSKSFQNSTRDFRSAGYSLQGQSLPHTLGQPCQAPSMAVQLLPGRHQPPWTTEPLSSCCSALNTLPLTSSFKCSFSMQSPHSLLYRPTHPVSPLVSTYHLLTYDIFYGYALCNDAVYPHPAYSSLPSFLTVFKFLASRELCSHCSVMCSRCQKGLVDRVLTSDLLDKGMA